MQDSDVTDNWPPVFTVRKSVRSMIFSPERICCENTCRLDTVPIQVTALSKSWVCGGSLPGIAVSNPTGRAWISLFCECCVLSGRGLFEELITHPEESYRVCCVRVWSWVPDNEEALAHWGGCRTLKKKRPDVYKLDRRTLKVLFCACLWILGCFFGSV